VNVFQGATKLSLDVKGRLAIPAKHRAALNGGGDAAVVLTAHPHGCLMLYPAKTFQELRERLSSVSEDQPQVFSWKRLLIGMAEELAPDAAGRILVSPVLRDYAGIEKQVTLVGQVNRFELWSQPLWDKQLEQIRAQSEQPMPAAMAGFKL
jgi:MraZ protein